MTPKKDLPRLRHEARPPRSRGRLALALVKWALLFGLGFAALTAGAIAYLLWTYGGDPKLPRIHTLRDYRPKQVTRILAAGGEVIGELYEERRTYVPLDRISPYLVQAIIDAEDAEFMSHEGLDFSGMLRALWVNLRAGETRQGASTITQQVVKTFLLSPERTLKRKLQEIILARRLENALSKEEILTLYLNQIYFGHGRYGVEEAARFYFGKSAADLDVGQAAVLAGLPQGPEKLSPFKHPEAAKARQTYVLEQMVKRGHLDAKEAQKYIDAPIAVVKRADPHLDAAPEIVEVVRQELERRFGAEELPYLGIQVRTTIDVETQVAARAALEAGLEAIDERQGYRGPVARLGPEKAERKRKQLAKQLGGAPRSGKIYEALVVSVSDEHKEIVVDLGGWRGAVVLDPAAERRYAKDGRPPSQRFRPHDLVRVRLAPELGRPKSEGAQAALALELGPQGAAVVIDPATRRVLALVGGYAFGPGGFNRALQARRQPGSAFKPIVYAAALDSGQYTAASIVNDAPEVYDLWKPKNYEKDTFRGPIRLREALAHSINTVAIRVLADVGVERVVDLARQLGWDGDLPKELSLALGSGVVSPLSLTNAFATFAADGVYAPPVFVTHLGAEEVPSGESRPVLRPEVAYLVTSLLTSVVEEGTATAAKKLKRPIAGKTGTSNEGRDAWFIGYTPDLVAGVWVGFDDMKPLGRREAGAKAALPIWIDLMKAALKGKSPRPFRRPSGVVVARIDRKTGKLAAPARCVGNGGYDCQAVADTMDEVFLEGTAPTEVAPAPGEVDPSTFVLDQMESSSAAGDAPVANDEDTATWAPQEE